MLSPRHGYVNGYIEISDIDLGELPAEILVGGERLLRKSEFHISLICAKRIAEMIDPSKKESIEQEIVEYFKKFIGEHPLIDFTVLDELHLVKRDTRMTLIVMTKVPDLDTFFKELEQAYSVILPFQPTHITLYTLQPETGIGILSQEELARDSEIVTVPVLTGKL